MPITLRIKIFVDLYWTLRYKISVACVSFPALRPLGEPLGGASWAEIFGPNRKPRTQENRRCRAHFLMGGAEAFLRPLRLNGGSEWFKVLVQKAESPLSVLQTSPPSLQNPLYRFRSGPPYTAYPALLLTITKP